MALIPSDSDAPACAWAVLDTNVVLDLWLFDDPRAARLRAVLASGELRALVTAAMMAELIDVLARPFATAWPVPPARVRDMLQACCHPVEALVGGVSCAPRCTDPDDQKFIDLAWSWPAQWLVSRDRAVLKLARPARAHGLHIVTPERWPAAGWRAAG
jgi:predicted nucleic acid-binding protein